MPTILDLEAEEEEEEEAEEELAARMKAFVESGQAANGTNGAGNSAQVFPMTPE